MNRFNIWIGALSLALLVSCTTADGLEPRQEAAPAPPRAEATAELSTSPSTAPVAAEPASSTPRELAAWERVSPVTGEEESPEERMDRLGTTVDPGADPDPDRIFIRAGREYKIAKYPRQRASYVNQMGGWVRPVGHVNVSREIYQQNDQWVWVWTPNYDPEVPQINQPPREETLRTYRQVDEDERKLLEYARPDFSVLEPPPSGRVIRFRESSSGLPTTGSWRNSLDVADMNGDGHLDLLVPPQRGPIGVPHIYLGDGKGGWTRWMDVKFPFGFNYGSATAADLDGDGNMDIVSGIHLSGIRAFFGDGRGEFTEVPGLVTNFATRRVRVADLDGDGDLDILALTEGPLRGELGGTPESKVVAFLNEGKARSWTMKEIGEPWRQLGGDWLEVLNLNGDRHVDFVASSIYYNGPDSIFLGEGKREWRIEGRGLLPYYSYYFGLTTGRFSARNREDAIMSFARVWPIEIDPENPPKPAIGRVVGLERVWWDGKTLRRSPVARWESERALYAVGSGDFDGDGHSDVVYVPVDDNRMHILLGDGKGGFRSAVVEGVEIPANPSYDLTVRDVNGDGRDDVIMMFEAGKAERDGSIRVWLNEQTRPVR
ncbi:MAG: FG-GAP repeat domain-containing protein [Thermoanaerobaculia bacterium]